MKNRISWIDITRGIAILMVIVGHSLGNYNGNYLVRLLFAVHLPVFFVLSGYLYRPKQTKLELKSDTTKLLIPYMATILVEVGMLLIWKVIHNPVIVPMSGTTSLKELIIGSFYGAGFEYKIPILNYTVASMGAIWFLLCFLWSHFIFNAVMRYKFKQYVEIKRLVSFMLLMIFGFGLSKYFVLPWSFNTALLCTLFIYFGYLIRKYNLLNQISLLGYVLLGIIWLASGLLPQFSLVALDDSISWLSIPLAITNSIFLMLISKQISKFISGKVISYIKWLGQYSMIVLCMHLIDLNYLGMWVLSVTLINNVFHSYLLSIVVGVIYRITVASLLSVLILKVPLLKKIYFPNLNRKVS